MSIELDIVLQSYWEHFKAAKDLAMILPIDHRKRVDMQKVIDELQSKINQLRQ